MQTHPKGWQSWLVLGILILTLTACSTPRRGGPGGTRDLSGRWNDTDSRLTAEALVKDALDRPWSATLYPACGA